MNPLISVIVPVYNVEKYLNECVESIVNQTYKNLEIILVDDGSPDNCPQMCDAWAERDERIKVIHKENGGLSDARNFGIDNSTGEYIIFIDSDDYIALDCIEILYGAAQNNDCDIAVCRLAGLQKGVQIFDGTDYPQDIMTLNEHDYWSLYYKHLYLNPMFSGSLINGCHKLIKKNKLEGVRFPVGKINEDTFTTYKIFSNCEKTALVNKPLYFYRIREGSISRNSKALTNFDLIEALKERLKYFSDRKITDLTKYAFIDLLDNEANKYVLLNCKHANKVLQKKLKKDYNTIYKEAKKYNAFNNEFYKNRTVLYRSFYLNHYLFRFIRKVLRKSSVI